MAFVRVCALSDIAVDEPVKVVVGRQDVAVARHDDEVFAVEDICSHAAVALSEGMVEECTIECWLHGSMFDLRTGKPTGPPATEPVATFPTEVRDGEVFVDVDRTLNGVTPQ